MNVYIETWKKTIQTIIESKTTFYDLLHQKYTINQTTNDIKEMASKQIKLLDDARPKKDESLYKQCNEEQKEFIDYLEKVILYGNLKGEDKVKL